MVIQICEFNLSISYIGRWCITRPIYGYVIECAKELVLIIPEIVQFVIMLYYWINEKFTSHGQGIKLDKNNTMATREKDDNWYTYRSSYFSVYGNNVINIDDTSIVKYE